MSVLDKRIDVEGALKDDKVYNADGKELTPIEPRNIKELKQIEELMEKYPNIDYLMALLLVQATPEELEELTKNPKKRELDTTTIIKQDFYPDEKLNLENLIIN